MLICLLTLHAAAQAEIDDVRHSTSLLQLHRAKNGTASSNTNGKSPDAAPRSLDRAEGFVPGPGHGGGVAARPGAAGFSPGPAPSIHDGGEPGADGAAATLTAAGRGRHRRQRHIQSDRHHRQQRRHAHQTHQYQGRDVGSLFENEVTSTTCSAGPASAAATLADQINVIRHNLDYRVSDVVAKKGFFWKSSRENLLTAPYDGTALQSLLKPCAARGDLDCDISLKDLADALAGLGERNGFAAPDGRTIVAYVRAGDVVGPCEEPGSGTGASETARRTDSPHRYRGDEVAAGLRDPAVRAAISRAVASGYRRLNFVVVESYADRAEAGEHGYWMYSDAKHQENRKQLRAAFQDIIEELCSDGKELSFGVASFVNVDETLFYLMRAETLVTEKNRVANQGFPWVTTQLTKTQNASTAIIVPERGPVEYPACSGIGIPTGA